ncbi:MAG: two pore domain potassium channel family protein [Kiritimatiellaeota bacterium]|nr:two pore domain potassium channel family protein [Kiritimatiellota bacterium]
MKGPRFINRVLREYPRLPLFFTLSYVFFALLVVVVMVFATDLEQRVPRFAAFVSFILLSGPLILTILYLSNIKRSLSSIRHLAILYIEIILMFGVIYFYLVSVSCQRNGYGDDHPISGVDSRWIEMLRDDAANGDKSRVLLSALKCFQDCLHFSLITSTTVGYGDMVPKGVLAKCVVDIQVLICLFLLSFGAGTVFAQSGTKRFAMAGDGKFAELDERLSALERKLDDFAGEEQDG